MQNIDSIFKKPLPKIKFPCHEEKRYPLYSQCLLLKRKIKETFKEIKTDEINNKQAKITLSSTKPTKNFSKQLQKDKIPSFDKSMCSQQNHVKSVDESSQDKDSMKLVKHQTGDHGDEINLPQRNSSKQHKWATKTLKRKFTIMNTDADISPSKRVNKTCHFDLLKTLIGKDTNSNVNNSTPINVPFGVQKSCPNKEIALIPSTLEKAYKHGIHLIEGPKKEQHGHESLQIRSDKVTKENKDGRDREGSKKENVESMKIQVDATKVEQLSNKQLENHDTVENIPEKLNEIASKRNIEGVGLEQKETDSQLIVKEKSSFINGNGKTFESEKSKTNFFTVVNLRQNGKSDINKQEVGLLTPFVPNRMTTRNMVKRQPGLTLKQQEDLRESKKSGRQKSLRKQKEQQEIERNRLKTIPCPYFVKLGYCNFGDECRKSHDVEVERKNDCCKFYISGTCLKGNACLFYHEEWPCKFFYLGHCKTGDKCKFSHKPLNEEMKNLLEARIEEEKSQQLQSHAQQNDLKEKGNESESNKNDNTQTEEQETEVSKTITSSDKPNPLDLLPSLYTDLT